MWDYVVIGWVITVTTLAWWFVELTGERLRMKKQNEVQGQPHWPNSYIVYLPMTDADPECVAPIVTYLIDCDDMMDEGVELGVRLRWCDERGLRLTLEIKKLSQPVRKIQMGVIARVREIQQQTLMLQCQEMFVDGEA